MNVNILHSNNYSPNEICFLYPLHKHKYVLKYHGIQLHFTFDDECIESNVCLLSSKWFSTIWSAKGSEEIFRLLAQIRERSNKIIWYDMSDSTGTTHFEVLPYVDRYLKNQIFVDKNDFLKTYYGSRVFCDFMHRYFNIDDDNSGEAHLNFIPDIKLLDKVQCGWNSGLAYFGRHRHLQSYLFKKNKASQLLFKNSWISPQSKKSVPVSCRIGTRYTRNTISQSRHKIINALKAAVPTEKLSHKQYYKELKQSVAALTPFGLGEISLRDFEVTLNGAAMIKQDMSHLETWPNLWIKNQTYLDFAWDLSDLEEKVQFAIDNPLIMRDYAQAAQSIYRSVLDSNQSSELFCQRFKQLIEV